MIKKTLLFTGIMIFAAVGLIYTNGGTGGDPLATALLDLCNGLIGLIGPLAYLLVVFAALIYLAGQLGDAQIRAKSSVWAWSAIFGALIGWVIITVVPRILAMLLKASGVTIECGGIELGDGQCSDIIKEEFCS